MKAKTFNFTKKREKQASRSISAQPANIRQLAGQAGSVSSAGLLSAG
jgi:hypothetical protein